MGFFSSLSFLTPVYIAAGLAVGLPILFHLIRRTPKGRMDFSSVMFLTPSPPRITRRSRIEHWLLLLLRALAVLLIVAAFMRPLWRQLEAGIDDSQGRIVAILLDTSGSMRRTGLWEEALQQVRNQITKLTPADQLTFLMYDGQVRVLMDRAEWNELDPAQRTAVVLERLEALQPGWGASHLDQALIAAADRLEQADAGTDESRPRSVVVVSDLQAGSRWEGLQSYEWPRNVTVEFATVGGDLSPNNAGVQLVGQPQAGNPPFVRVRVTNSANSQQEKFEVGWRGSFDAPSETAPTTGIVPVYVPPGQSRVVRLPRENEDFASTRVAVSGDDHPFDNQCSVSWPERRPYRIVYLGADDESDRQGLRFFLRPVFADTDARVVTIESDFPGGTDPAGGQPTAVSLVIASGTVSDVAATRSWIANGGTLLYVCREGIPGDSLFGLAGVSVQPVVEASVTDYAMLREVDFTHPMFQAFNDPRYSDLSKVHFWKHRRIDPAHLPSARVLARLDSDDPLLLELPIDKGRLLVLTAGWNRSDSDLATWSKFIPMLNALLEASAPQAGEVAHAVVGDVLPLASLSDRHPPPVALETPDGTRLEWAAAVEDPIARQPGLYRVFGAAQAALTDSTAKPLVTIAVNLPASESQTAPLGLDVLDAVGLRLSGDAAIADDSPREEQLARGELESRQKLWRYLLLAALLVLFAESFLAGRQTPADLPPVSEAA